jgi:hypothetical protein
MTTPNNKPVPSNVTIPAGLTSLVMVDTLDRCKTGHAAHASRVRPLVKRGLVSAKTGKLTAAGKKVHATITAPTLKAAKVAGNHNAKTSGTR